MSGTSKNIAGVDEARLSAHHRSPAGSQIYAQGARTRFGRCRARPERMPSRDNTVETPNPPITVYDTSGPYTDPDVAIDSRRGLLRRATLGSRGKTSKSSPPPARLLAITPR